MVIDNVVAIQDIILISLCVVIVVSWRRLICDTTYRWLHGKDTEPQRIFGLGVVLFATGSGFIRFYSFGIRELGLVWLRDTWLPPLAIAVQGFGVLLTAYAFYMPAETRKDLTGIYWGIATAVLLIGMKVAF